MKTKEIEYQEPIEFFKQLNLKNETAVFLYSSTSRDYSGKYSVIGLFPDDEIETNDFDKLRSIPINENTKTDYFVGGYFGYLSYNLKNQFEKLPIDQTKNITHSKIHLVSFEITYVFYHSEKKLKIHYKNDDSLAKVETLFRKSHDSNGVMVENLKSNFTKKSYLNSIRKIKDYIFAGDIFEVNLTRKYWGNFKKKINPSEVFIQLTAKSPSQYSAFMKFGDLVILSSSPERFLKIKGRRVNSKPIKGTRPRSSDHDSDQSVIEELMNNQKDRAENLMIVDLVRNDLGRIAEPGSVKVTDLFKVESYETVHQLVSTIEAIIDKKYTIFDTIKAAFPPGSMTGAPKIRAMEIITELEQLNRGIYSGAIGYIGLDSYVDLSVVIRTLIIQNNQFEFQVGGAIVSDSVPEDEYLEILDKAKAIASVLNLDLIKFE